ncbi:uncharacterized protein DUF4129 [Saccharopolyspora erythraea NRRL 2338]|uniref:Transglutaminase-like domain-containing protein n=1 Tax=Saccharopolyspora erythraea TaxID=1836 RepID=A0ABN1C6V8_SACER|nr:DUF3488 and transglutaminase-like domain-containing protein [Saccharopolyspora erythraea]PFG98692.1 uncharacterized protein DUF4129 [Saccharopolyspora erythraea NRRL 2338]
MSAGPGDVSAGSGRVVDTSTVSSAAAAMSVALASTAFSGVIADARWVIPALLTIGLVAGTGVFGRTMRWWPPLVVLVQGLALTTALTTLFTKQALLGFLPGPAALGELSGELTRALDLVREGVPPVPAETALQALVCLGLGLVAILVDIIAVALQAPAVAGLVLLCVYAIPASLADDMLPWWSFVGGALAFALLLASGGHHQRWQRRESRDAVAGNIFGRTTSAVAGASVVIALLTGTVFTGVGTEGRLPGAGTTGFGTSSGGVGLQPFTSLRGQLDRSRTVDLFRVRGLTRETYLRAMTLRKFDPANGWKMDGLTQGVDASQPLPLPEGTDISTGTPMRVDIEPLGYRDPWLPVFGTPEVVSGMGPDWRYDPAAGIVFTQTRQQSRPYSEQLTLSSPTPQQLRSANGPVRIDPAYLDTTGIPPEVADLARRLTADQPTDFDKATALNRFFTDPSNGFSYELETAPPSSSSALSDFLFRGKRGYCEQFASSMAVLLRAAGIPSRVAVGFTSGYQDGDARMITTDDAHAWVEAYFPGWGWTTFDPTPLDDGRTSLPDYLHREPAPGQALPPPGVSTPPTPTSPGQQPQPGVVDDGERNAVPQPGRTDTGSGPWPAVLLVVLVALVIAACPAALREARRRLRLRTVAEGGPGAAGVAWRELLDEFWDRGTRPEAARTVRHSANALIDGYALDAEGSRAVRALVGAVEREWYAPSDREPDPAVAESLREAVAALHRSAPLSWQDRLLPRSVLRR